jgi:hypothetical protein
MADPKAEPVVITVDKITPRGKYSTVKHGENYYNVWDALVLERLNLGETYTVMVTHKTSTDPNTGEEKTFHNIVGLSHPNFTDIESELEAVMPGTKAANPKSISTPPKPPAAPTLDFMIDVRKTALLCTTRLLATGVITGKGINKTLAEYERYIVSGLPVEQKISSPTPAPLDLNEFVDEA